MRSVVIPDIQPTRPNLVLKRNNMAEDQISSSAKNTVKLDNCSYTWSQTLKEVEVIVPVKPGTRGKDLAITLGKAKLSIGLKGAPVLFSGNLEHEIKIDDSTWTVDDQKEVVIHLEKIKQEWWSCVIEGHQSIDTTKIQPENSSLSDLDGETRAMVEKMMVMTEEGMMTDR